MRSETFSIDSAALLVADASAIISLNATGCAHAILKALSNPVVVVDVVPSEFENGRSRGRRDADILNELLSTSLAKKVALDAAAAHIFEQLVIGPAAKTLDDSEAATVAYAVAVGAIPIIDERKAARICTERFSTLGLACTVDILAHPEVEKALGKTALADAVFNALRLGHMRVLPHHIERVIGMIGADRTSQCASLLISVRTLSMKKAAAQGEIL